MLTRIKSNPGIQVMGEEKGCVKYGVERLESVECGV